MRNKKLKLKNFIKRCIVKTNYYMGNYNNTVWLVGDGRSGTTWVSNLINYDKRYRELFEPVHPIRVAEFQHFVPHEYIPDKCVDKQLEKLFGDIFSGKFCHKSIDRDNRFFFYQGLLIKDIFANLLCYSVHQKFEHVKLILLIRNPFAVALSKQKKIHWYWETDPLKFLAQQKLFKDYLWAFEDIIRKTAAKNDFILNQILIWAIIYYVPLKQFSTKNIHICFYENICENPIFETKKLLKYCRGSEFSESAKVPSKVILEPSRVVTNDAKANFEPGPSSDSWKHNIPQETIAQGMEILQNFGLASLYNKDFTPNSEAVYKLLHEQNQR